MDTDRIYSRSPIQEAIIEIRVQFDVPPPLNALRRIHEAERDLYPEIETRSFFEGTFTVGPSVSASTEQTEIGFIGWGLDRKQSFQARQDGFTFSRLAPYVGWPSVIEEAARLYDRYSEITRAGTVTRCGVRYINRFDFENLRFDLEPYFATVPKIPPALDTGFVGMLMQLHIPQPDLSNMLILNLASVQSDSDTLAIVLDLDAFSLGSFDTDEELWNAVEALHTRAKVAFEASITDELRERIR